tara:strand:+ start:56 stop:739 length:684 start_codon:yes stop_codon:yes gene_type:complete
MAVGYNPKVVIDGLVLALDAGNTKSYPGSGTSWTDLIGSNTGTLTNGPTFSSDNGGSIVFDGTNDYVTIPNNTSLDNQKQTVEVWIKTDDMGSGHEGFWFEKGSLNTQYSLFHLNGSIYWRHNIGGGNNDLTTTMSTYMNTSNWYQVVGTYTSGDRRLYINGVQVNSDTASGTVATNSGGMSIGAYNSGSPSYFYNGNYAICRVYNKALTASEVQQNYNELKGRYLN